MDSWSENGWNLQVMKTNNGVIDTAGYGCSAFVDEIGPLEFVVYGEKDIDGKSFIGFYVAGHTENEAILRAKERINK